MEAVCMNSKLKCLIQKNANMREHEARTDEGKKDLKYMFNIHVQHTCTCIHGSMLYSTCIWTCK